MASIQLKEISRKFGKIDVIEGVTFRVPDGQFCVLVGPSGCGKSTILRMIAGLESVTAGEIYIGDRLVNQVPARQRDVAMVFQNYALYPHMTVAENLAFGLQMRKVESATLRQRVETVAQLLEISHLLDRKPKQLSGGQQQRVALGRAIARQPQVFLLDEPLSNLDAQLRDNTRAELKQLHRQVGITTLYVTHDQTEAMTLADQIVVLNRGKIQQIGEPETVYNTPINRMVASFLGNPPMNIWTAVYQAGKFHVGEQELLCPQPIQVALQPQSEQRFDLGMRAEHIQIGGTETPLFADCVLVEPLGRETLVRAIVPATTPETGLNLLAKPDQVVQVGDRMALSLNLDQLFVFDAVDGSTLYPTMG
jgi:multiple sugar transport system ATP-binding protein